MFRTAVTISLVPQARSGPFIFHDDLPGSIRRAATLGYDAVELFFPGPDAVDRRELRKWLEESKLSVAAVGTGAGMLVHQLSLTSSDSAVRDRAVSFVADMIRFGAEFGAPAIIGSMQGRWTPETGREEGLRRLADALQQLGQVARPLGVPLIYEPLNRYETNLCNTQADGVTLLKKHSIENVTLLADLFHMNIEEVNLPEGLRDGGSLIGHVHFVDSNRRPAGLGHLDFGPVLSTLRDIGYKGYLSVEAFPWPDSDRAAQQTLDSLRSLSR